MEELKKQSFIKIRRTEPKRKLGRTLFVATFTNNVRPEKIKIAYTSLPFQCQPAALDG